VRLLIYNVTQVLVVDKDEHDHSDNHVDKDANDSHRLFQAQQSEVKSVAHKHGVAASHVGEGN